MPAQLTSGLSGRFSSSRVIEVQAPVRPCTYEQLDFVAILTRVRVCLIPYYMMGWLQEAATLSGGLVKPSELSEAARAVAGINADEGSGAAPACERISEEWWPEPLLCKRFGVSDPHKVAHDRPLLDQILCPAIQEALTVGTDF
jgi:hypothetical protein